MPTFVTLAKWTDEGIRTVPPSAVKSSKTGSPQGEGRERRLSHEERRRPTCVI